MKKLFINILVCNFLFLGSVFSCEDFSGDYELRGCVKSDDSAATTIRVFDLKEDKLIGHYERININQSLCKSLRITYGQKERYYKVGNESLLSPYNNFLRDTMSVKLKGDSILMKKRNGDLVFRNKRKMEIKKTLDGLVIKGDYVFRGFMTGKERWTTTCRATRM